MRYVISIVTIFIGITLFTCRTTHQAVSFHYPQIEPGQAVDTLHGMLIPDPYRQLEAMESDETKEWANQQEVLLNRFISDVPNKDHVNRRLEELTEYDLFTVPAKRGEKYFYLKVPAGEDRASMLVQHGKNGTPEVLIDPREAFGRSKKNIPYSGKPGFYVNAAGAMIGLLIADGPSRWYGMQLFDAASRKFLKDTLAGFYHVSKDIVWDVTDRGFYYVRYRRSGEESDLKAIPESPGVYYHQLGNSQEMDPLVYQSTHPAEILTLSISNELKHLIVHIRKGSSPVNRVLAVDLQTSKYEKKIVFAQEDANYLYLGNRGDQYWFYTDLEAANGRIIAIDLSDVSLMTETIKETDEHISANSLAGGNALGLFGDTFVIMYTKDGVPFIRGYTLEGALRYEQPLPVDGSVWGGFYGHQADHTLFFQFLGFTEPSIIYELEATTGHKRVLQKSDIPFDSENYVTEHIFYKNKEGIDIPMFVTHQKGVVLDGENPGFIYAYGTFGWNSFLWYQPHLLVWLENGGIYAQPSIRGGGEYGKQWHEAGVGLHRQNAVDDFIAAAAWLIDHHYTAADKLVLNGGSASGALAGSVLMQRPELFGASVLDRPSFDMVRFAKFTNSKNWIQEFGSPEDPEAFEVLHALSPYHQLDPYSCYPPTLVMVGEKDEVTPPLHAYKFVARLQATEADCEQPSLLKIMRATGHTFGATPELVVDSRATELLFLFKVLGIAVQKTTETE